MRTLFIVLILLTIIPMAAAQSCESIPTRLEPGMVALVTPGEPNNVRAAPTTSAESVGSLPGEATFTVLGGPTCADGFNWFHVKNELLGVDGYTVEGSSGEYWTIPATLDDIAAQVALDFQPIASQVDVTIMPPEQENYSLWREPSPRYLHIMFDDVIFESRFTPEILILPLDEYAEVNPDRVAWMMDEADLFLEPTIELSEDNVSDHQVAATRVSNDWMSGIGYVNVGGPPGGSFTAYELKYNFSGITRDRRFWIDVTLPVTSEVHNHEYAKVEFEMESQERYFYMRDFAEMLTADDFYPHPKVLNGVVTSLNAHGTDGMPNIFPPRLPDYTLDLSPLNKDIMIDNYTEANERYFISSDKDDPLPLGWVKLRHRSSFNGLYQGSLWESLRQLLQERPIQINDMPGLISHVDTTVISPIEYIDTDTLSGVAFFSVFRGGAATRELTWHFQGLTHDEEVVVIGFFTVEFEALPESKDDLPTEILTLIESDDDKDYETYLEQIRETFASTTDDDFSPPLNTWRSVIMSYQTVE